MGFLRSNLFFVLIAAMLCEGAPVFSQTTPSASPPATSSPHKTHSTSKSKKNSAQTQTFVAAPAAHAAGLRRFRQPETDGATTLARPQQSLHMPAWMPMHGVTRMKMPVRWRGWSSAMPACSTTIMPKPSIR